LDASPAFRDAEDTFVWQMKQRIHQVPELA
jgi:hypothetical protein